VRGRSFDLIFGFLLATLAAACSGRAVEQPRAEYDHETGRIRRLTFDFNRNGHNDAVSIMDGTHIDHIELDFDEDGKVDRWDFYRGAPSLQYVGLSRLKDGVMDSRAFYDPAGDLARIEVSTRRDDRFNRVEFYDRGVLVRSEEDTNGDGRPDKWETYRRNTDTTTPNEPPYVIASVAFDDSGSGTPQRRLIYDANGRGVRVEHPSAGNNVQDNK
jgi:hypothetical protein